MRTGRSRGTSYAFQGVPGLSRRASVRRAMKYSDDSGDLPRHASARAGILRLTRRLRARARHATFVRKRSRRGRIASRPRASHIRRDPCATTHTGTGSRASNARARRSTRASVTTGTGRGMNVTDTPRAGVKSIPEMRIAISITIMTITKSIAARLAAQERALCRHPRHQNDARGAAYGQRS